MENLNLKKEQLTTKNLKRNFFSINLLKSK